ncbi:Ras family guanine nucleotide exchange factor [Saccharomycopsis crataegensis]|uniref:Ras family guanine nucleotide exchange factor n=1 Tax=Saccharomycopsis crataegensis TaxID=43959 RepID=A0AAV5QL80_9ASCO|nr:Ras family guanine nucleotide exchange factor [Saccharomycopsis crataegensis]
MSSPSQPHPNSASSVAGHHNLALPSDPVCDTVFKRYIALSVKPIDIVQVLYNYGKEDQRNIIPLAQDETVYVMSKSTSGWWDGIVFKESTTGASSPTPIRGWFPKSFTKQTNLLQYIKSRLDDGAENQLPQPPAQDVNDTGSISKESLRSSTSDIALSKSNNKGSVTTQNLTRTAYSTASSNNNTQDSLLNASSNLEFNMSSSGSSNSKILSLKEAKRLVLSTFGNEPIYWLPQMGPEGKTLFYNADLDIYCDELPFTSGESNSKTNNFSHPSSPVMLSETSHNNNNNNNDNINDNNNNNSQTHNDEISKTDSGNLSSSIHSNNNNHNNSSKRSQKFVNFFKKKPLGHHHNNNNNNEHHQPQSIIDDKKFRRSTTNATVPTKQSNPPSIFTLNNPSLNNLKDTNFSSPMLERNHNNSTTSTANTYTANNSVTGNNNVDGLSVTSSKKLSHNIFEMSEFFIQNTTDLTSWDEYKDTLYTLLDKCLKCLVENDKQGFNVLFNMGTKLITLIHLTTRLYQDKLVQFGFEMQIKKRLHKISRSVAQIMVNGNLYLNLKDLESGPDNNELEDTQATNASESVFGDYHSAEFDNFDYEDDEFFKMSTNNSNANTGPNSIPASLSSAPGAVNTTEITNKVLAAQLEQGNEFDLKKDFDKSSSSSYLGVVKIEIKVLKRHIMGCYKVFKKLAYNAGNEKQFKIPQLYPRFVTGFFSGGSWQNPFFDEIESLPLQPQQSAKKKFSINSTTSSLENSTVMDDLVAKRKELAIKDFQQRCKKIVNLSNENLSILTVKVKTLFDNLDDILAYFHMDIGDQHDNHTFHNNRLYEKRNFHIISSVYRALTLTTLIMDIFESFDISTFNNPVLEKEDNSAKSISSSTNYNYSILFGTNSGGTNSNGIVSITYPILIEFFEVKQDLHNTLSDLIMDSQSLTSQDPSAFKFDSFQSMGSSANKNLSSRRATIDDMAQDLKELLIANGDIFRGEEPPEGVLTTNFDKSIQHSIGRIRDDLNILLIIIGQLIDEKENLINYTERVMHNTMHTSDYEPERRLDLSDEGYLIDDEKLSKNFNLAGPNKRKKAEEVPWYLDSDEEYDLYYDARGEIKGGTKEVLVTHLTNHENFDPRYNKVFLSTFRSMMTPGELIDFLIARFNIQPPEGLSFEEYDVWVKKKAYPIRLRCVNIMKMLLQKYWIDTYSRDRKSLENWLKFTQKLIDQKFPSSKIIYEEINARLQGRMFSRRGASGMGTNIAFSVVPPPSEPAPKPILPTISKNHKNLRLFDIDPVEFARQLTVKDFELYSQITLLQCLERVWKNKYGSFGGSKHIAEFINNSNRLTDYVSYMVLRKHDISKRAKTIHFFIEAAENCRKINNFSAMTAIISALASSPIHRLRKTWSLINDESRQRLDLMNKMMNPKRNFYEYREMVKYVTGVPCVPFVGVYLTDLTFIANGTPDYLNGDPNVINFYKRSKMESIISNILAFQAISYSFKRVESIQEFIIKGFKEYPSPDSQYQISLILEPRESASSQLNNINALRAAKLNTKITDSGAQNGKKNSVSSAFSSTFSEVSVDNSSSTTASNTVEMNPGGGGVVIGGQLPTLNEILNMNMTDDDMQKFKEYFNNDDEDDSSEEGSSDHDTAEAAEGEQYQEYEPYDEDNEDEDVNKLRLKMAGI